MTTRIVIISFVVTSIIPLMFFIFAELPYQKLHEDEFTGPSDNEGFLSPALLSETNL